MWRQCAPTTLWLCASQEQPPKVKAEEQFGPEGNDKAKGSGPGRPSSPPPQPKIKPAPSGASSSAGPARARNKAPLVREPSRPSAVPRLAPVKVTGQGLMEALLAVSLVVHPQCVVDAT